MLFNRLIVSADFYFESRLSRPSSHALIRDVMYVNSQSQALALTHKASPPSRPSSVSSLPRSPQSHQSQQSQPQSAPQSAPQVHPLQSQTPLSAPQTPFSAHNQHPKQEINASPKQEGFDLSKSASSTGKSPATALPSLLFRPSRRRSHRVTSRLSLENKRTYARV